MGWPWASSASCVGDIVLQWSPARNELLDFSNYSPTWRWLVSALCSCLSGFYSLFHRRPPPPLSYVDTEFTWLYYTAYYTVLQDSVHVKIGFTKNLSRSEKPRYVLTRSNRSYHKCFPVRLFNCSNNQYRELSLYLYLDLDPLINIYTPNKSN